MTDKPTRAAAAQAPKNRWSTAQRLIADLHTFGATQSHIARIVGVSKGLVSRWESGDRQPGTYALRRLGRLHAALLGGIT